MHFAVADLKGHGFSRAETLRSSLEAPLRRN